MATSQANIRTFIAPLKGSGRTSATLLEDLILYDPRRPAQRGYNLLRDSPLNFVAAQYLSQLLPSESCRHVFCLKHKQSFLPPLDERAGPDTIYIVAAFCQICRTHLTLKVDFTVRYQDTPCPNTAHPLHHLISSEWRETSERNAWLRQNPDSHDEIYTYECSSKTCSAAVTVRLSPAVLLPGVVHALVDKDLLRERTESAFKSKEGNTEGMKHPLPVDVLIDLRVYIRNAWREDPKYKSINLANRRFIVRFGPDGSACKSVLEYLGFRLQPEVSWQVPEPNVNDLPPFQDSQNIFLDNIEHELGALILSCPAEDRQQAQDTTAVISAGRELARALGAQDYDKDTSSRTTKNDPAARPSWFTGLGIPSDAHDELVVAAYRSQITTDPANTPWYLSYLRHVATARESELLQTEVVVENSKGLFDSEALLDAYKYFGLPLHETTLDDDHIIGVFSSRLDDSKSHEHQMRDYLRIIGVHRKSQKICDFADNMMDNYDQALQFLNADQTTSDESIQVLFTAKTADNSAFVEQAEKAVKIIAQHRMSASLKSWVDSGFSNEVHLDAAEGYQALQIDNRLIDDDLIITQYSYVVQENPASIEYYNKALMAIAQERDSNALRDHVQGTTSQPAQGNLEEPVGLENIGNTCYLNSLLQFLFTIASLRNIVLDFDAYQMDPTELNLSHKKVGQRKVTLKEVQTAQKFVASLSLLFRGMIQSSQSSIKPQQELARLILETDNAKEKLRRRSTLMSERPSLGHLDSQNIQGPFSPMENPSKPIMPDPTKIATKETILPLSDVLQDEVIRHEIESPANGQTPSDSTIEGFGSDSSDATLVSKPGSEAGQSFDIATVEQQKSIFENKENLRPAKISTSPKQPQIEKEQKAPLSPVSPSKLNVQAGALSRGEAQPEIKYQPPPGKPPPVPPRKPVEASKTTLEEYARQQDVQEVLAHCLFQLSCAIRPTGSDASGEQLDEIHDLFFGLNVSHSIPEKDTPNPVQFFNIITRVVHQPKDVYAALDTEFDLSIRDNGSKAFLSVSKLPPVFSIALDRVIWNKEANRPDKLNDHVEVPEIIYMDRYLEATPDSELMLRRKQTWEIKRELSSLMERLHVLEQKHAQSQDVPSLLEDAKLVLEHLQADLATGINLEDDLNIDQSAMTTLGFLADQARSELEGIKKRIDVLQQQVKEAFADMRKHAYRLHAAFFHRGNAGGGHYWVYIYDHVKEVWRKYNDDRVSVVQNLNEIFGRNSGDNWGSPPTPYFLVYVKGEFLTDLVETVKREITYPIAAEAPPMPSRNQISEMPPNGTTADVEMKEWVNDGEEFLTSSQEHVEYPKSKPLVEKVGSWDSGELTADPRQW